MPIKQHQSLTALDYADICFNFIYRDSTGMVDLSSVSRYNKVKKMSDPNFVIGMVSHIRTFTMHWKALSKVPPLRREGVGPVIHILYYA